MNDELGKRKKKGGRDWGERKWGEQGKASILLVLVC